MHVLFLDIDGVLNSEQMLADLDRWHAQQECPKNAPCDHYALEQMMSRSNVERLNRLLAAIEAKVVISSSWRNLIDHTEILRILRLHGFEGEVIGATPDLPNDGEYLRRRAEENGGTYGIERIARGHEIAEWLRLHPEVTRFVILDDTNDMAQLTNRLVLTDGRVGLSDEDVELAIRVMSWSGRLG